MRSAEPLLSFVLGECTDFAGRMVILHPTSLRAQMRHEAENFIMRHVTFHPKKRTVTVSKLFDLFRGDFGRHQRDLLVFLAEMAPSSPLAKFVRENAREKLDGLSLKFTSLEMTFAVRFPNEIYEPSG